MPPTRRPRTPGDEDAAATAAVAQFESALTAVRAEDIIIDFVVNSDLRAQWYRWMQAETIRLGHLLAIARLPSGECGHIWVSENILGYADRLSFAARALSLMVTTKRAQREADLYTPGSPTLCKFVIVEQSGELYTNQKIEPLITWPTLPIPVQDGRITHARGLRRVFLRLRQWWRGRAARRQRRRTPSSTPPIATPQPSVA